MRVTDTNAHLPYSFVQPRNLGRPKLNLLISDLIYCLGRDEEKTLPYVSTITRIFIWRRYSIVYIRFYKKNDKNLDRNSLYRKPTNGR